MSKSSSADKIKIGIVGCGSIGSFLCRKLIDIPRLYLWGLNDILPSVAHALTRKLPGNPEVMPVDKLLTGADLIVETAGPGAVPAILKKALAGGKQVVILSVGGVLSVDFDYVSLARENGGKVYFPSGALGGLDAVKAARVGRIDSVTLTTRKPPEGLKGAPYLMERGICLDNLSAPLEVFSGSANEAVKAFPKNINVAATLSLAGIGAEKTAVRILADPNTRFNSHEITVEGDFGKITSRTENTPSPNNPKTSYLAALSTVALIRQLASSCKIGT